MELNFNLTGAKRKELVSEIARIDGSKKEYLGVPSCAYRVGDFHISKDGVVSADEEKLMDILETLRLAGFEPAGQPKGEAEEEGVEEATNKPQEAHNGEEREMPGNEPTEESMPSQTGGEALTIEIPLAGFDENSLANLDNLIKSKGWLIKKALGIEALPIKVGEASMKFPWLKKMPDSDECKAFTDFIGKLAEHSKKQKRISSKVKETENEKYAFRCFLLRLGFIGTEYKKQRKILLSRLNGSSAFKGGKPAGDEQAKEA